MSIFQAKILKKFIAIQKLLSFEGKLKKYELLCSNFPFTIKNICHRPIYVNK